MVSVQRVLIVVSVVVLCHLMVASAQFDFGEFFGNIEEPAGRDPRESRGPVTFPVTQPGAETSGVVVGASGFGFVPPGGGGNRRPQHQNFFGFW